MPGETKSRVEPSDVSGSAASGATAAETKTSDGSPTAPSESVREAMSKIAELHAYAHEYLSAKADEFRLRIRHAVFLAVVLVLAVLTVTVGLAVATVMFFTGLAGAVASLLGGRVWAGELIIGGGMLALVVAGTIIGLVAFRSATRKATVAKYELTQRQQRQRFGRSSSDRTAAAGKVEL